MSDWKQVKLNSLIDFYNGFAFKSSVFQAQGIPVLKIKNVKPNRIILNELAYVSPLLAEIKERYLARKDDILITMSGNRIDGSPDSWVGKVARFKLDGTYLINQRVSFMRVKETLADASFLGFYLSSWEMQNYFISKANSSGGQANISPDLVKDVDLSLPSLPEQKAIASVLSSLDDKIDLLHRQNKTLEAMAETLFRQWFIEEAKEDWKETKVLDVFSLVGGGTPKTSEASYWDGDIPWLSGGDIANAHQGFIVKAEKAITELGLEKSSTKLLPKLASVISARGTVGKYAMLSRPMTFSQSNYGIIPKGHTYYYFVYLLLAYIVDELSAAAYGSVFDTITTRTFEDVEIKLPSMDFIAQFESEIAPLFEKKLNNVEQIQTLENLRDTLLPKLMSGEVRVQYQTEEVA